MARTEPKQPTNILRNCTSDGLRPVNRTPSHMWVKEFPGAITVCDSAGIIIELNDRAIEEFRDQGGEKLIGTNLLDCHPEPARTKLKELMDKRQANVYTVENNGVSKLIHQTPWYVDGGYRGFVELSLEIPREMPHFVRSSCES
jgi:transcriptional regulator with PAS, ATPase and Fis domain